MKITFLPLIAVMLAVICSCQNVAECPLLPETCKAANQGDAEAQFILGMGYYFGEDLTEGVAKDTSEAVRWFRMAANQGHTDAQFNLGLIYSFGKGVAKDTKEAVRWYRIAAEQGHTSAQNHLGDAYWNGEGVITDKREAYIWYSIAKVNGIEDVGTEEVANTLLGLNWRDYLSQAEIRSAQKEAAQRLEAIENR